jgi:hypothetical protein
MLINIRTEGSKKTQMNGRDPKPKIVRKRDHFIIGMVLSLTFLVASIALAGGPKTIKKYPIPDHGTLELNVPASWKGEVHRPQGDMPPTILFKPATGDDFQVLVTVMWSKKGEPGFNSQEKVRALIEKDGQKLLLKTVETKIALQEIKGINHIVITFSSQIRLPIQESTGT